MDLSSLGSMQIANNLPPELLSQINVLIKIMQAAGVMFIIYLAFLITQVILNWKRNKKVNEISAEIKKMNGNLKKLLNKKKK